MRWTFRLDLRPHCSWCLIADLVETESLTDVEASKEGRYHGACWICFWSAWEEMGFCASLNFVVGFVVHPSLLHSVSVQMQAVDIGYEKRLLFVSVRLGLELSSESISEA